LWEGPLEPAEQRRQRLLVRPALGKMLVDERRARTILRKEMNAVADPLAFALAVKALPRWPAISREQCEFDARRAGVEDEDPVAHDSTRFV
jgi:hypothetical protein